MNVIVAVAVEPFQDSDASRIARRIGKALERQGHEVEVFEFPFHPTSPDLFDQILALRLLDVSWRGDCLVAVGAPGHLVRHQNKRIWFTGPCGEAQFPENAVAAAYRSACAEARSVFTHSQASARRCKDWAGVDAEALYLPAAGPCTEVPQRYGDYVLCRGRLGDHWQTLVKALALTRSPVCLAAGAEELGECRGEMENALARHGLERRFRIVSGPLGGMLPECLGVLAFEETCFAPLATEAQGFGKAVIEARRSPGCLEWMHETGWIVTPEEESVAAALDRIYKDPALARGMGARAPQIMTELGMNWEAVAARLIA